MTTHVQLDYSRDGRQRRKFLKRIFALMGALALGLLGWRLIEPALLRRQFWKEVEQCEKWRGTSDQPASGEPACWTFFRDPNSEHLDVLFLHERLNPSGKRRLVVIRGKALENASAINDIDRRPIRSVWYHARVFDLSSAGPRLWSQTRGKESDISDLGNILDEKQGLDSLLGFIQSKRLVLLNGKPDDKDGSRFVIDFIHDGGTGQIDGWLDEQDCIHFGCSRNP